MATCLPVERGVRRRKKRREEKRGEREERGEREKKVATSTEKERRG